MTERVIYFKGGRAIEEARSLFPRAGELPDGGPDKFLLAVLHFSRDARFRLASFGPAHARIELLGREVIEYGGRSTAPGKLARRLAFAAASLRFVWDTLRMRPTRVLCGQDGPFALFVWLATRLSGAQFVLLAHNALALPSTSQVYKQANRFLCRRADLVVAHGPFVRDEALMLGTPPERVVEFNNALDPEHVQLVNGLQPKAADSLERVVLYVGRMEEDKGVVDLLNAFRQLTDVPRLRLRFVGNGSANSLLRDLVVQHGLQDRVEVLGPIPFGSVFALMKQATVLVTPSQSRFPEGFCKSAMEAFYVGTPVVAPDYGPFPYMVKHEDNGLLYRPDDVSALAAALRRLMQDEVLLARLGEGALRWGHHFMYPHTTFAKAVARVFAPSADASLQGKA